MVDPDIKKSPEPKHIKSDCPYCANAPINHAHSYFGSILAINIDPFFAGLSRYAPRFLKDIVDFMPFIIFPTLRFFNLAEYSDDIDRAVTFRSRVMWEEARRRGIQMEQMIVFKRPLEIYRAKINDKHIFFESIPVPSWMLNTADLWDDKSTLKRAFDKNNIPVPKHVELASFRSISPNLNSRFNRKVARIFKDFKMPIIVKPRVGSRGRHTTTNISTTPEFYEAIRVAKQITPYFVVEEHLMGEVCRATIVNGKLAGFYLGGSPIVVGDGVKTIEELIKEKNLNKHERVGAVEISDEIVGYISRSGFSLDSVPKAGERVQLTYRTGRLFGGVTREMIDDLHPSFVPILEKAGKVVDMVVTAFDCIIPNPEQDAGSQRWGIIECNSLPFIDLHYYALEGKPRNIAGMIWDLWDIKK